MGRVQEGEEKTDRYRLDVFSQDTPDDGIGRDQVERDTDTPLLIHPLGHLKAPRFGNQRGRPCRVQGIEMGPVLAADLQDVTKAGRCDEGRARSASFQDGVGRYRGPMDHRSRPTDGQFGDALQNGKGRITGRGQQLVNADLARIVQQAKVGERAPYVNAKEHYPATGSGSGSGSGSAVRPIISR